MGDRGSGRRRAGSSTVADYLNTYYGRLATRRAAQIGGAPPPSNLVFVRNARRAGRRRRAFPAERRHDSDAAGAGSVRAGAEGAGVRAGRNGATRRRSAPPSRGSTGSRSASETGTAQFKLARGAINLMKRAYPQFMAAGGEQLPREMLTTIFPLGYWDLIKKYSAQRDLDPYLMAALDGAGVDVRARHPIARRMPTA